MLTGDLVRARVDKGELRPSYVDVDKVALLDHAEGFLACVRGAVEDRSPRGLVEEALEGLIGDAKDVKLLRGVAKILLDRCEFEVGGAQDPKALRKLVFERAAARGPLALERGPLGRMIAMDVLTEIAAELRISTADVENGLYADLHRAQQIVSCDAGDASWLLQRYNVALVQSVLLHASEVRIVLEKPTVGRLRQLFRHVKFHQLVHQAERVDGGLALTLDGPSSLFSQSTRYGLKLASFFPALLLQDGPWHMEATILWTKANHRKRLSLKSTDGLV